MKMKERTRESKEQRENKQIMKMKGKCRKVKEN